MEDLIGGFLETFGDMLFEFLLEKTCKAVALAAIAIVSVVAAIFSSSST
jgi:hypothetical protein